VAEKDFGSGPFHLVVYDETDGKVRAVSANFSLPNSGRQTVSVTLGGS